MNAAKAWANPSAAGEWKRVWIKHRDASKAQGHELEPGGSKALGILKIIELNGQWEQLWFPQRAAA